MDIHSYNETTTLELNEPVGDDDEDQPFDSKILLILVPVFLLIAALILEAFCHREWRSNQEQARAKRDDERRKDIERRISIKVRTSIFLMPYR